MKTTQEEFQARIKAGHSRGVSAYYALKAGRAALVSATVEQRAEKWILRSMSPRWVEGLASHLAGKNLQGGEARWFLFTRTVNGQAFTPSRRDYIQEADTQSFDGWRLGRRGA